ncbi:DUF397 domain-containing protein [Actinoplanes couchii]|uniref:DUF397 domain-containing protein n=2 Tax=Actinoplanes couchii TaxID=403638 RepID=A0ABQ3XEY3_9ACTN|nr:DUF397 domain-containing protein [Actinoplanes couchii]
MKTTWQKSSYSVANGACVEVSLDGSRGTNRILVRDSKNPSGGTLAFALPLWTAFVTDVKSGRFPSPGSAS